MGKVGVRPAAPTVEGGRRGRGAAGRGRAHSPSATLRGGEGRGVAVGGGRRGRRRHGGGGAGTEHGRGRRQRRLGGKGAAATVDGGKNVT
jgi:hypothetical protein